MKKQLSILFADNTGSQVYTALGYFYTDAIKAKESLGGVHGHEVKIITREEFEAMPDEEQTSKPVVTLADRLSRLDSKGIQALIENQATLVNKKNEAVEKLKKQGEKMDGNKFNQAKDALDSETLILNEMTDALSLRLEEEKAQAILEAKSKASQEAPEGIVDESPAPVTEASQEVTQ
jgi:hypothetical protein